MNDRGRRAVALLVCGLLVGALADAVLRVTPWGLNAALVAGVLMAVLVALGSGPVRPVRRVHVGVITLLAAGMVWRDATVLKILDAAALATAFGLLAAERGDSRSARTLAGYFARVSGSAGHTAIGPLLAVGRDVPWREFRARSTFSALLALGRGLLLAVPVLVVFGGLLGNADAIFARRLKELIDVDVAVIVGHALGTAAWGWAATGLLRAAILRERPAQGVPPRLPGFGIGPVEVALVLGSVDALFMGFVWVQLRYLFGGAAWVQAVAGLSYAEYARRGFFELVAVAALVLALLLVAHWLLNPRRRGEVRLFGLLAVVQVALVLVMLGSALFRMRLYQAEYGLTELRFYTTAFMLWLGVLLVWAAVMLPLGRREAFARGTMATGAAALLVLHVADPERFIVEANRRRGPAFDAAYAARLGADAAPVLVEAVAGLPADARRLLAQSLLERWDGDDDWRRWSVSRQRAQRAVADARPELRGYAFPEEALQ
jgi:hypothetical protein